MVTKRQRMIVLWPEYFDSNLSIKQGRRVPAKAAVSNPKLDEITLILKQLNIKFQKEPKAAYPSTWFKPGGRVLIPKKSHNKQKILKWVSRKLKASRQS